MSRDFAGDGIVKNGEKKHFGTIDELILAIENKTIQVPDHVDRHKMVFDPIREEMKRKADTGKRKLLYSLPVVGNVFKKRQTQMYLRWISDVFPQSRCDDYVKDTKKNLIAHASEYKQVWELLDADSKRVFLDLICLRLTGDFRYVIPFYKTGPQYFSPKLTLGEHPNVVDGGGFIGDTLISFLDKGIVPGRYCVYELEENNYGKLIKNARKAQKKGAKVRVRRKGLYSKNGTLYFVADGDSSHIVDYPTDTSIDVVTIDSDVKMKPDFIKMDIEGSEYEALLGAAKTIKQSAPALAICIYHLKDDFWKIPLLIKELNPEYNHFWIEHYQLGYNETVLYVTKE